MTFERRPKRIDRARNAVDQEVSRRQDREDGKWAQPGRGLALIRGETPLAARRERVGPGICQSPQVGEA